MSDSYDLGDTSGFSIIPGDLSQTSYSSIRAGILPA